MTRDEALRQAIKDAARIANQRHGRDLLRIWARHGVSEAMRRQIVGKFNEVANG